MTIKTIFLRAVLIFVVILVVVSALIFRMDDLILVVVVIFVVASALLFRMADPLYLKAPTDDELITNFQQHRAAFERLRDLVLKNRETRETNRKEFQSLKSEISSGLTVVSDLKSVRFIFAGGGLSAIGPGWLKGIEYVPGRVATVGREGDILKNLDQPASLAEGGVYLRLIEPNWFIVFEKYD